MDYLGTYLPFLIECTSPTPRNTMVKTFWALGRITYWRQNWALGPITYILGLTMKFMVKWFLGLTMKFMVKWWLHRTKLYKTPKTTLYKQIFFWKRWILELDVICDTMASWHRERRNKLYRCTEPKHTGISKLKVFLFYFFISDRGAQSGYLSNSKQIQYF